MSEQEVGSASQQLKEIEEESAEELDSLLIQASQQFEESEEKSEEELDSLLIQASQQFEETAAQEDKFDKCEDHLDSLLLQASQQFEDSCDKQQGRFGLPVTTQSLMAKVNRAVPANTRANTKWVATVWSDWRHERRRLTPNDVPPELTELSNEQLQYWLPIYVTEVRTRDNRKYPGRTLYNMCAAIQ